MQRILFVCLGNICRSPAAEAVFASRSRAAGLALATDSAGTIGWHVGEPPYGPMIAAAARRGYDLSALRARQVTLADLAAFDLVFAMDRSNLADLAALRPAAGTAELRLYLGQGEVPDPWYTRDFDAALDLIEEGADRLVARLGTT
ncbi:MAG: low molecular weight phosphotyrosine protein phosphatase [Rhodobacteraceae bacterium]|jgi:protein-tyrosine phosphatase|uniref:low molecular weight protein-tyrosine-phosphatase n=1 Tax=Albidovulum sp. TaxID=1872424 RepID=UPI001DBCC2BE|nr:low molecular weight protein-tyrosine-phosphatase [uncultured Defluviimonas sp.]MCB2127014.1 low molecular weight phosphotyrosine protein phosphatase [Paracoccaceae bacterium]MCC0069932.1 low molecular weight phosphotyrosine protein phosphatase [Paracoccaceae bacterium]